ncbi:MAG: mannose-1-phosphate guanylyltransferase [Actinomycetales bacterium]|nr:MAG: mannose-1-phosphate guanylyltransferase [Actinomycetales bacterium]
MDQASSDLGNFWAVVPAGGAGTRLWPLSRRSAPKFLLDLTGSGRTLLQATWDRLTPLSGDRVVVVTGTAHAAAVAEQLPGLDPAHLLAEPHGRDSMPAIALAAAVIARRDPEAVIGSFAADHVIGAVAGFHAAVREAVLVAGTGRVVTIGITPTAPATGFGYIREGATLDVAGAPSARVVAEFVEKPDAATAASYLATGGYRWNAGMFVVGAQRLLDLLRVEHPDLAAGAEAIAADPCRLDELWPTLTRITIDHAVAEPAAAAGQMAVVPAVFDWDDIGDFDALATVLAGIRPDGLHVLGEDEDVVTFDTTGLVAAGSGRLVAVLGLSDIIVVDTPDAVLVAPRSRAQQVKRVVDGLAARHRDDLR